MGILRKVVEQTHDQRLSSETALRDKLKASAVPLPPDLFEEVAQINALHIDEVMTDHPGRTILERYNSYLISARVLDRSAISQFVTAPGGMTPVAGAPLCCNPLIQCDGASNFENSLETSHSNFEGS